MSNKGFRKQVKQAQKAILDENRDWHDNFMRAHYPESDTKGKRSASFWSKYKAVWISLCAGCLCAVMVLLGVFVFLPNDSPTAPPRKEYAVENNMSKFVDLVQLNADLTKTGITIGDINGVFAGAEVTNRIIRFYDTESGDILWYKLYITYDGEPYASIALDIYPNPYYKNNYSVGNQCRITHLNGLTVSYVENVEKEDNVYEIKTHAIIEYDDISMFIEYKEWSYEQQSNFLNFIEQTIKVI